MTPEHWQELDELFHAALERAPEQRAEFLDQACAGNEKLRRQVDALLAANTQAGSFIDVPAFELEARASVDAAPTAKMMTGQAIGHYRVIQPLGSGGMGEVYLAKDTKLDRNVALKILPSGLATDRDRMQRFVLEAKAASALNHPNILTIHEIGEADGQRFIVTEFIEGVTLRERLRSPLDVEEALEIAIQISSALAAAHKVHIIHRDIKPENVMIRRDEGLVKVLDFGLAKITQHRLSDVPADSAVDTLIANTGPGVVMGTVAYMSPEQARGEKVDERTDIWSLGVVLFEMIAGCSPFVASSSNEIISSILSRQPAPPLARFAHDVPERLEEIIEKALSKDRQDRYQTSRDLLIDLKRLKQSLESKAAVERSTSPDKLGVPPSSGHLREASLPPEVATPSIASASTAEYMTKHVKSHKHAVIATVTALLLIASVALLYGWRLKQGVAARQAAISSIAVLPFVNTNSDPDTEYLSDGITDSLINSLSRLPNLKVMSRNSVFHYKGKESDVRTVGQTLGVRAVLTGTLLRRGENLSITVELVDADDNTHLWGGQYNRKLSDLLTVQTEIVREISEQLRLRTAGTDEQRLTKQYTEDTEAYQLYLKGRFYWNKRTTEAYRKAVEFFNQAIEKDPNYALAYAGLAGLYSQGDYPLPPKERMPFARRSALKAIELDNTLAEPHSALGRVKQEYDWDWEGAEKEFRLAIELDPNSSLAHMRYQGFLTNLGKHEEAVAEGKKAVALDPVSPLMNWNLEFVFYWARRYDEAIAQGHKTLEIDPTYVRSYYTIGDSYERKGMYEQAFEWFLKGANLNHRTAEVTAWKDAYEATGVRGYYRKRLDLEMAQAEQDLSWHSLYLVATLYAQLGEKEKSLEWLQKALEERPYELMFLKIEPAFDDMRSDPRFVELMKRVGIVP